MEGNLAWHEILDPMVVDLRATDAAVIKAMNQDREHKHLRGFSQSEAAEMLGVTPAFLRTYLRRAGCPLGERTSARRTFELEEVNSLREWLHSETGDMRFAPTRRPGEPLSVLAFTNLKGGVGKSTLSVHTAQYLTLRGYRVLLVDLDAQASSTSLFGLDPAFDVGVENSIAGWISRAERPEVLEATRANAAAPPQQKQAALDEAEANVARTTITRTYWDTIDIVAAGSDLHVAEIALSYRNMQGLNGPANSIPSHREIARFLEIVGGDYDVAVLDCRPDVNNLTTSALHAATGLVIPMLATHLDNKSTREFLAYISALDAKVATLFRSGGMGWKFIRLLTNRYNSAAAGQVAVFELISDVCGRLVIDTPMVETSALVTAGNRQRTLYEHEPTNDRRAFERAIAAANAVGLALERDIHAAWGRKPLPGADASMVGAGVAA
jgi:chromosome partitioning protein